jgi:dihydrofolate reductase
MANGSTEVEMARVVAGMTMSIDGYVANDDGAPEGLYPDLAELQDQPYMRDLIARTGAVIMGRGSFAMPDDPDELADSYEFQVPLFIVTSRPPARKPKENGRISFTFVTDGLDSAVRRAKAAAGDRDVTVVGGPALIGELLARGLVDELHVDVMPVFLGSGKRFFDRPDLRDVRLEKAPTVEVGQRTSLRFRIVR